MKGTSTWLAIRPDLGCGFFYKKALKLFNAVLRLSETYSAAHYYKGLSLLKKALVVAEEYDEELIDVRAANAIGDDRLQMEAQGYTVPDAFTHGTSDQRMRWFKKGFRSGKLEDGDTFNARDL